MTVRNGRMDVLVYSRGYGSSFSYTFNNDTWKKWKEKLSGTGDSDKEKKRRSGL